MQTPEPFRALAVRVPVVPEQDRRRRLLPQLRLLEGPVLRALVAPPELVTPQALADRVLADRLRRHRVPEIRDIARSHGSHAHQAPPG